MLQSFKKKNPLEVKSKWVLSFTCTQNDNDSEIKINSILTIKSMLQINKPKDFVKSLWLTGR